MTTGPQGNGMLHHDEAHEGALGTVVIAPVGTTIGDMEQMLRDRLANEAGWTPAAEQHAITVGRATL